MQEDREAEGFENDVGADSLFRYGRRDRRVVQGHGLAERDGRLEPEDFVWQV